MPDVTAESEDFCPSCGSWITVDPNVGWCYKCIAENTPGMDLCNKCGKPFMVNRGCDSCKREEFLAQNADRIEELMSRGVSLSRSLIEVRKENRPACVICNRSIRGAKRKALFCKDHPEASRLFEKYRKRQNRRGFFNQQEALRETLNELNGN